MNDNKKGQSLIHKTDNLLDFIYDSFDCPLFVARQWNIVSPQSDSGKVLTVNLGQHKLKKILELYKAFIPAKKICF